VYANGGRTENPGSTATPAAAAAFAGAAGDVEFQLDATKVNTTGGWRDMKIGIFARRESGESATAAEWDSRVLPAPTARVAFAAVEPIERFAPRLGVWAARRMSHAHRLRAGRSIGSGMVEGAAKNLLGKRMERTGARWVVDNAEAMAAPCSLSYDDHRDLYWASPN
jgi:hypothetical protein